MARTFALGTKPADVNVRRGFETALLLTLEANRDNPATIGELSKALLDSGLYHTVAPRAAALRPTKPVSEALRRWTLNGWIIATDAPDPTPETAEESVQAS